MSLMKQMLGNSYLFGANAPFIEELYESYLDNPASVPTSGATISIRCRTCPGRHAGRDVAHAPVIASFAQRAKLGTLRAAPTGAGADKKQVAVLQLINAYRFLGNRWAQLDPLKRTERPAIPELDPAHYGFTEADLGQTFATGSFAGLRPSRPRCARSSRRCARPTAAPSAPSTCTSRMWRRSAGSRPRLETDPLDAGLERRGQAPLPASCHPGRDAGALPAHPLRRPEALLARRRRSR
jgi:hypothetical protein